MRLARDLVRGGLTGTPVLKVYCVPMRPLPPEFPASPEQFRTYELCQDPSLGPVLWFSYKLATTGQIVVGAVRGNLDILQISRKANVCIWGVAANEAEVNDTTGEVSNTLDNYWDDPFAVCTCETPDLGGAA